MDKCNCFNTNLGLTLLDEEKIPKEKRRACSMSKNGNL